MRSKRDPTTGPSNGRRPARLPSCANKKPPGFPSGDGSKCPPFATAGRYGLFPALGCPAKDRRVGVGGLCPFFKHPYWDSPSDSSLVFVVSGDGTAVAPASEHVAVGSGV